MELPSAPQQPAPRGRLTVFENGATRPLRHGELTEIIIGVIAAAEKGIRAVEVTRKLNGWGIEVSNNVVTTTLSMLSAKGRIYRVRRGVYAMD